MKSYNVYQDSRIEWLGEIPSLWNVKPLKFLAEVIPSNIDKKSVDGEKQVKLCNYVDVYKNDFITRDIEFMQATASDIQITRLTIREGDVIATKDSEDPNDIAVPALVKEDFEDVVCGYHLTLMRSNQKELEGGFLFWLLNSKGCNQFFSTQAKGVTRYAVGISAFKNLATPVPSMGEQTQIARYLNHKTFQIDKLITDKEKLIELLNEERTAIINQAVTKGLNPNVPMKDSGIEWLGEVPQHWEVKRMKYLCDIGTGEKDTENREEDGLYPFFVRSQTIERISSYSFDGEAILTAGDGVGVCKVWHYVNEKFDYHQRVYRMSDFQEVLGKFLFFYLKENFEKEVKKLSAKSTVDSLRRPMFQNFQVSYPPIDEQIKIINRIENEEERIESLTQKIQQEIQLLKEYKTALISEVVTGKVDVRDEVIAESPELVS